MKRGAKEKWKSYQRGSKSVCQKKPVLSKLKKLSFILNDSFFRKEEIANMTPALPSLVEEEETQLAEFGQSKLHELAALEGSDLLALMSENPTSLALRNADYKTPRQVALDNNAEANVKQIGLN
jgi:hypothetical protein